MPIQIVPDFPEIKYHLVCYDKEGCERFDDLDASEGKLSSVIIDHVKSTPVTDIFLMSHGWKGDVPAAIEQYDRWIGAMANCSVDRAQVRQRDPNFKALLVGLHWPSLPFGDEGIATTVSFSTNEGLTLETLIKNYATRIADTQAAHAAIETIFKAAMDDIAPLIMPPAVRDAYLTLNRETCLGVGGAGARPGSDREPFDPERAYRDSLEDVASFGGFSLGGLLAPLQQLSFYVMKDRARKFGETGAYELLKLLQEASIQSGRNVRFHLQGHSFGCIVISSMLCGPGGDTAPPMPVSTVYLVQGALSLWSYCADIPQVPGTPGYFRALASGNRVDGPVLTTISEHDYAVGRYYPLAAGIKRQVSFVPGTLPKYGAIGAFGVRGDGIPIKDIEMLPESEKYEFEKGSFYNIDASKYIKKIDGASGAHSDIAHGEVAHAFWEAMAVSF